MAEQRYQAVLAVISDGETVTDVAARFGVARKTVHNWLAKYEAGGLENLGDRSHRPRRCPHQMGSLVEVEIAQMRAARPSWGPRRLAFELAKREWSEKVAMAKLRICAYRGQEWGLLERPRSTAPRHLMPMSWRSCQCRSCR